MTDEEILKAFECCCGDYVNGTHCKDCPAEKYNFDWCSDEVLREMVDYTKRLQAENVALRERLNITKMALEYACLETLQSNEQYLEELKEKVNKYIKQSEDVVYGQKNGVTFRFAEARLAELKGGAK